MASAKFLEEALSTDVDESAVNAIVGSLETQLVTSTPASSTPTGAITTVNQNHINSAISNGGPVCSQKHGVSLAVGSVNNIMLNDASKTNTTSMATVQTSNIGQVNTVVASVPSAVNNRPNFVNQVTSSIGLTQTTLSNLTKGQESVRILYSTTGQASGGMNINSSRLPFPTQTVGALQNGNVGLTSLSGHTVVNPGTTVVTQNQLSTNSNANKQITQNIGVLNAIEQAKASGAAVVIKASGNPLGSQAVSIASAVMPVPMSVNSSVPMTVTSINSVVTGSTVTTSGSGVMTLSKPLNPGQGVASQGNILSGNVQILNVNAVRPTTPGVGGQKSSRVVIGGPHIVGARPGTPGQITLQALQGLQAGAQGLLLKTENGQFQLLRVGPAQGGASAITPNSNASPAGQTFRIQPFPGLGSVAVATTSSTTTSTAPPAPATVTAMQTTSVPVPALASTASAPAVQPQPRPAQVDTTKEKCRKFLANLLELSSREPKTVERNVRLLIQELVDCKVEPEEFCERLERLLNASPQPCLIGFLKKSLPLLRQALVTKELVIEGIRPPPANVIFSTNNTSTSNMVPPLQATQLRPTLATQAVRVTPFNATSGTTQTVVGGMPTPRLATVQHRLVTPLQLVSTSLSGTVNKVLTQTVMTPQVPITTSAPAMVSSSASTMGVTTSQPSLVGTPLSTTTTVSVVPVSSAPMLCRPGAPGPLSMQPRTLMPIKQTTTTIRQQTPIIRAQSPVLRTPTPVRVTTPLNKTTTIASKVTPKLTPTQQRMQGKIQTVMSLSTAATMGTVTLPVPALASTDNSASGILSNSTSVLPSVQTVVSVPSILTSSAPPAPVAVSSVSVSAVSSVNQPVISSVISSTPSMVQPPTPVIFSQSSKQPPKEKEKKSFSSAGYTGDDDINDVAAMGGVNLAEETQRILGSTEFVGTQIRSCKDDIFLHASPLQQKIRQIVAKHGLDEPTADVAALISHATQERLKNIVEKLAVIAEHRMDIIKLDPRYEVTQDVKGQLKFLEELDRMERKRHDEKEREVLLRAAKSRSKSEDPEQAKLKAKAKEMQRAEMEEVRQREANMTALQAIGSRKKPRLDGPGGPAASLSPGSGGLSTASNGNPVGRFQVGGLPIRPRLKRVNLRDLLFLLEQEKETCRSSFLYKAYLK